MKVLLVDDHQLIRDGMRPLLAKLCASGEELLVFESATLASALDETARHPDLDFILLDLRLPDATGFDALARLQARRPDVPIVMMSGEDDGAHVREALARGAVGYITKSSTPAVILSALRLVLSGGTYVPPEVMNGSAAAAPAREDTGPRLNLTQRQLDVLGLLVAGKSNKQICRELDLAEGTVKAHLAAIFRALDVSTRVQAVVAAGKLRLIRSD